MTGPAASRVGGVVGKDIKSSGLACPHCGVKMEVKDSRPRGAAIYRRRECPSCLNRVTTVEMVVTSSHAPLSTLGKRLRAAATDIEMVLKLLE